MTRGNDETHPYRPSIEHETRLLHMEHSVGFLIGHGNLERSLVLVGVKDLSDGIHLLQPVFLEGIQQDLLGHLQSVVKVDQILIVRRVGARTLGNRFQRTVEVVDRLDQVLGKLLDRKVLGRLLLALGAVLQVAEVGDGTREFVLHPRLISQPSIVWECVSK